MAKDTKIKMHKSIFDNTNNDPRLMGVSSKKKGPLTTINKGIFTSCKENDNCPPWSIEATEIKHDKNKKQIDYKNALLRVYNVPVLYFPKFFHPDPTVERQSGILRPVLNSSNVLGSSFSVPYYHVIADESDLTITPTIFNNNTKMIQNEYRKLGKNYQFKANFGHTRNYNNSLLNEKNNISYLFSKLDLNLDLKSFNTSKMTMKIEKVTNDTFLKVFDNNLFEHSTSLKPSNKNNLSSELKLFLDNEEHSLALGIQAFEDLQLKNSDRYQYILPYYNFNKSIFKNYNIGSINFNSNGNNNLENTNQLKSRIINNISYSSFDFFSENGVKNNFNLNLKNLNSVGKNVSEYKSSPQIEFSSIFEFNSSIPLIKKEKEYSKSITPKLSIRVNPSDMKNYNDSERSINTQNIFSVNRLGINDSFESGKSLTVGIDYKKELLDDINKYFTVELATVLRDKEENFIPKKTSLNQKSSNLFGSISNNLSENININYNFAIDNNFDELVYNDINATLSLTNFKSTFNFVKETGIMGDQNFLKNTTSYKFNDENYLKFNTRRNRKLNLTEFYDLVYEYKNDCLTAGIKYKKTYYEDRDLKPSEDLLLTITLFPLTTYEQKIDQ